MGYSTRVIDHYFDRSVSIENAHIARSLRPDDRILDVGCGSGSLTIGFAQIVTLGSVVGVDRNAEQVSLGTDFAEARRYTNVRFHQGDVYSLPFGNAAFEVVSENALLMHVSDVDAAIAEMKRVLVPGGRIALRDRYSSGSFIYGSEPCPIEDGVGRMSQVLLRSHGLEGADFDVGITHRGRLKTAGFDEIEIGISPTILANDTSWAKAKANEGIADENWTRTRKLALESGLLTSDELDFYKHWQDGLLSDPAAVSIEIWIHATARKPLD